MPDETLTGRHITAMTAVLILGNSVLVGAAGKAGQDGWISLLLALLLALPLGLLYGHLTRLTPGLGLFELLFFHFGRVLGGICVALTTLYALHVAAMVIYSLTAFITVTSLPETPVIPVALLMLAVVFSLARKGVTLLGRWSFIVLFVSILLIAVLLLFSFSSMDAAQIAPVGEHTPRDIGLGALSALTFPFGEAVLIPALVGGAALRKRRSIPLGMLIGGLVLLVLFFLNLFVLGRFTMKTVYFPTYNAARILSAGQFLERIETLITVSFLLSGLTKITVCLMAAARGVSRLFLVADEKILLLPLGLAVTALGSILYKNILEMFSFFEFYRLYALFFQAVIPLVLLAVSGIKMKKRTSGGHTP